MLGWVGTAPGQGRAELSGELVCPAAAPGRVVCSVILRASKQRLVWADVLVTATPNFAKPLRARIGFPQRSEYAEQSVTLPVPLVAIAEGTGRIAVEGRVVLCAGKGRACSSRRVELTGVVQVQRKEQP